MIPTSKEYLTDTVYQQYVESLRSHYLPRIHQHKSSFAAVDWGSERSQQLRFQILASIAELSFSSLLDVGCGNGGLVPFLQSMNFRGKYLGIDTLSEMVMVAKETHPAWQFETADLVMADDAKLPDYSADYVLGSGLFTFCTLHTMKKIITAMFNVCTKGVAINSLSSWAEQQAEGELYADPLEVLDFCRTLTPWVVLRHDYMPHDFTVYLYRERQ